LHLKAAQRRCSEKIVHVAGYPRFSIGNRLAQANAFRR
jgi:hypothetical protein